MTDIQTLSGRRIAVIYDCLFPHTVGGGERWYRQLAEGLAEAGAQVTYLTRRQWDPSQPPQIPGVQVVAVSGRSELYDEQGKRRLSPTVRFGAGLLWWLTRNRRSFDVVQVASFPFWSVLAVRLALVGTGTRVVVDWFEIWSQRFWRTYAGPVVGVVGYLVQRGCLVLSPTIIVLSAINARRLRQMGRTDQPIVLAGFLPSRSAGSAHACPRLPPARPAYVLFAGRHVHDKGVDLLPRAFAAVRRALPDMRFVIAGDGPLRLDVIRECDELGISAAVDIPGFVLQDELDRLIAESTCVVVPSRREGYGFMPVDAMGRGTPVVTTAFEENLAVANVDAGRNGLVADPPTAEKIAEAIVAVTAAGEGLRQSTLDWYIEHAPTKTVDCSVEQMVRAHAEWASTARVAGRRT
jgi:glycosyltransferase involved in cell wall biosynthesis